MTGSLFPEPTPGESEDAAPAKPNLKAVTDDNSRLLHMLDLMLGLEPLKLKVTALEQDGRDPEDAQYTLQLSDGTRITLGTIAVLMSRAKTRDVLLVRLGASPPPIKTADWQDNLAEAIRVCATISQSAESLAARAAEWVTQYLELEPPTRERNTACLQRYPYIDEQGRPHLTLNKLAKWISANTTEQIHERKLAAALRDNGWTHQSLNYYPEGDQADSTKGRRSTASYYRQEKT